MLAGEKTEYLAGLTIWGDAWDLRTACNVIHEIGGDDDFLVSLAYDLRHAHQGDRMQDQAILFDDNKVIYGEQVLWPAFALQVACLRREAGFMRTTAQQQSMLYNLEFVLETTLLQAFPDKWKKILSVAAEIAHYPDNIAKNIDTRLTYFASLNDAADRDECIIWLIRSLHPDYSESESWPTRDSEPGWIPPEVFQSLQSHSIHIDIKW
ncbi:hypothetical protein SAMN02744133_10869 [Thalassospira xiamenensis M-5 = DSM 17429]|uniref:Uncharacterized protein n=1 Tax=Thalassospira xiamenensis M-5 = DSM 17429 TaxID=1123366 RepID=A0AB72UIR3_9PROT|nr:hypothetical protein [Thalassospira xiamenensis]AJD54346.1 hypothetical protein TH3_21368 [Thalassospira xiamenensis M-5 = DSM 17429]SIT21386.1 hypothetical protein SAMN02744133_10869 [Thalassospira xiamenensis M-5 = DSM 17429]